MAARRSPYLDRQAARGIRPQYYDPEGTRYGIPTFPFHFAPEGLLTRRQLRAKSLAPGGHDPVAQIKWKHRKTIRVAYLYDEELARPKRVATPAQLQAIDKALTARKTCPSCRQVKDYCIPTSLGECPDCHEEARHQPQAEIQAA
jgi:hypothetical protein